jgi:hypothetical protein
MRIRFLIFLFLLLFACCFQAQENEIDRLMESELKMTFPSIYFKNLSADYATMPYTADSCFKYIAKNKNDIHSLVLWRHATENDQLTLNRARKIETELKKFMPEKMEIISMGTAQKISQKTIKEASDSLQTQYLLSMNSVLDVPKTKNGGRKARKFRNHIESPRLFCWGCISHCFHVIPRHKLKKARRMRKKREGKRK